jgi:DNA-binding XRE family transcriptional regulator
MTQHEAKIDLRMARTVDLRYTQERMAREIGCSLRSYSRWEKNGPPTAISKLVRLMVATSGKAK